MVISFDEERDPRIVVMLNYLLWPLALCRSIQIPQMNHQDKNKARLSKRPSVTALRYGCCPQPWGPVVEKGSQDRTQICHGQSNIGK